MLASLDAGTPQTAIAYAEYVVRASEQKDVNALNMLANVYQAAGYQSQALTTLRIALPLAQSQAPQLIADLKSRMSTLENTK